MGSFLETILETKKREVAGLRGRSFGKRPSPKRPFVASLDKRPGLAIIAEIKKASPSKGLICESFDPVAIGGRYEKGGASAISVLTDEKYFQGHIEYLIQVREAVLLPVLRKDFIIDPLQVEEAAHCGADALLLIAEVLSVAQLKELYKAAQELDLDVLIELHGAAQLDKVMQVDPPLLGINNRDLFSFKTDCKVTVELMKHIPKNVIVVSESGIQNRADAETLRACGVRALLVGESLMRSPDAGALLQELQLQDHRVCPSG